MGTGETFDQNPAIRVNGFIILIGWFDIIFGEINFRTHVFSYVLWIISCVLICYDKKDEYI